MTTCCTFHDYYYMYMYNPTLIHMCSFNTAESPPQVRLQMVLFLKEYLNIASTSTSPQQLRLYQYPPLKVFHTNIITGCL